jgi:colanic acid biosynthesis glycosyl transferase WcaI
MRILLINQSFYPDHVSTAQHLTDLAVGLADAGHEVTVVASSRAYDQPERRFSASEKWRGIRIHRIWVPGLGKSAKWRRFIDFFVFWLNAARMLLFIPRNDVTVCLTSPPLISTLGTLNVRIKGGKIVPWVMDLNPDEAVAAGWLKAGSIIERTLSFIQNWSLRQASRIIVLDRFMAERLMAKGVDRDLIHIEPPWSHDQAVRFDIPSRNAFRSELGLTDKFVIMYSGNHSPCHPLDTVLAAVEILRNEGQIHFLFAGGGSEFRKVEAFKERKSLTNISTLPYQPLDRLSGSLSSADLHLVVMGDPFVGIVHPCKIYNIMTLGIPLLFVGPERSHGGDIVRRIGIPEYAYIAEHSDVDSVVAVVRNAARLRLESPNLVAQAFATEFSHSFLCPRLVSLVTGVVDD